MITKFSGANTYFTVATRDQESLGLNIEFKRIMEKEQYRVDLILRFSVVSEGGQFGNYRVLNPRDGRLYSAEGHSGKVAGKQFDKIQVPLFKMSLFPESHIIVKLAEKYKVMDIIGDYLRQVIEGEEGFISISDQYSNLVRRAIYGDIPVTELVLELPAVVPHETLKVDHFVDEDGVSEDHDWNDANEEDDVDEDEEDSDEVDEEEEDAEVIS
jgi:hypothetical protein